MSKLSKFYESFRHVPNQLSGLGAIADDVVTSKSIKLYDAQVSSNIDKLQSWVAMMNRAAVPFAGKSDLSRCVYRDCRRRRLYTV